MKTGVQTFIEKSTEGGYTTDLSVCSESSVCGGGHIFDSDNNCHVGEKEVAHILLDPGAWKAVGKVSGWYTEKNQCGGYNTSRETKGGLEAQKKCSYCNMHRMIDHIANGGTPESYLKQLFGI